MPAGLRDLIKKCFDIGPAGLSDEIEMPLEIGAAGLMVYFTLLHRVLLDSITPLSLHIDSIWTPSGPILYPVPLILV